MSDLNTIARRHADEVRDVVADARLPLLDTARGRVRRPVWALVAGVVMLLAFSLPFLFGSDQPGLEEPVVATTVPGPVETSTVTLAPGAGFIPTGSMSQSCAWCEAVLLDDGRVLVLGGAWAEIYDPVTWTFTVVEDAPTTRIAHPTAGDMLLLADGRVLVVGPPRYELGPSIVEIFDPATGTFRSIENPPGDGGTAVLLGDGRVLILGIATRPTIFDPVGETFDYTAPVSVDFPAEALLLDDGLVLVLGSQGEAELYDSETGASTPTGPMITARSGFTATKLADGRVLIVGGDSPYGPDQFASAELYDPDTGVFTQTGSMVKPRASHAAALLPDGRVLVVGGGWGGTGETQATAEIYDPVTGLFTEAPPLTTKRLAATAVPLADGTVLIFGHYPGNMAMTDGGSKSAEIFTLAPIEPPIGCCGENPTVFVVTGESLSAPARVNLVVPPGGFEGATVAGYSYAYGDDSGGIGQGGELTLPDDCAQGCVIPLPNFDAGGTVETGYEFVVWVEIAYEGKAPDEASMISLSFDRAG